MGELPLTNIMMKAAGAAGSIIAKLLPGINPSGSLDKSVQLLSPTKLFCKEVVRVPQKFAVVPCAMELGCKASGRRPEPGSKVPPPEQVRNYVKKTDEAPSCHHLRMGDRFIEIGDWRLTAFARAWSACLICSRLTSVVAIAMFLSHVGVLQIDEGAAVT